MYLPIGVAAGILAGLFGVGGGIIFVPALLVGFEWLQMPESVLTHVAVGTSLACVVVTATSSTLAHHRKGSVIWLRVKEMTPFLLGGAIFGAWTADQLSSFVLRLILGLFLLVMAIKILSESKQKVKDQLQQDPSFVIIALMGSATGWVSSMLGIAGGALTVPFLKSFGLSIRNSVGTASALGVPIALAGTASFIFVGTDHEQLPPWSWGYVYLPAFFGIIVTSVYSARWGAKLAHFIDQILLQRLFGLMLLFLSIRMIWTTTS